MSPFFNMIKKLWKRYKMKKIIARIKKIPRPKYNPPKGPYDEAYYKFMKDLDDQDKLDILSDSVVYVQIPQYIHRPTVVEAVQYTGDYSLATMIKQWPSFRRKLTGLKDSMTEFGLVLNSGTIQVVIGDFVIRTKDDEFYPCRESLFSKIYFRK